MIESPGEYLIHLLDTKGRIRNGGEVISVLEHSLQSAYLAAQRRLPEEMVVAALLHDVGYLLVDENLPHEQVAYDFLTKQCRVPEVIACTIRDHTKAKIVLARYPPYKARLSQGSLHSLEEQAGIYTEDDIQAFLKSPYKKETLRLRVIDEHAKLVGVERSDVGTYSYLVLKHAKPLNK